MAIFLAAISSFSETLIVLSLVGLVPAVIGAFFLLRQKRWNQVCSSQVDGTVKDVTRTGGGRRRRRHGGNTYRATFTYSLQGVEYTRKLSSLLNKFSVGQRVTVFYDPSNPERHYVLEHKQNIKRGIDFIGFGSGSVLFIMLLMILVAVLIEMGY